MAEPTPPTPPAAVSNLTVAAPLRTVNVTTSSLASLQAACAAPAFGDDIVIPLGTYDTAFGIMLPAPTGTFDPGTGSFNYVTIRSANLAALPAAGTRVHHGETLTFGSFSQVQPDDSVNMPLLRLTTASQGFFQIGNNASYYRFVGLHFTSVPNVQAGSFLFLETPGQQNSANTGSSDNSTQAHHIIIDRCLIHGDPNVGAAIGIFLDGGHMAVRDSQIYDIFGTPPAGTDAQAIEIGTGSGPFLIQNNDLNANTETIFVGQSQVAIPGLIPSDITIYRNHIYHPPSWGYYNHLYTAGTVSVTNGSTTVTLTGGAVVDPAWADGATYFAALADTFPVYLNAYPGRTQRIQSVNVGANTLTLNVIYPGTTAAGIIYKITRYNGIVANANKSHFECKHGNRIKFDSNIWENDSSGGQNQAIMLLSMRGVGASGTDFDFINNWLVNMPQAITMAPVRPQDGPQDGMGTMFDITAHAGDGFVQFHTQNMPLGTGDCVRVMTCGNVTQAIGDWVLTVVDAPGHKWTIPVAMGATVWNGVPPSYTTFMRGTPAARFRIKNNLIEDVASLQYQSDSIVTPAIQLAVVPALSGAAGVQDLANSSSGTWGFDDLLIEHNTFVSPSPTNLAEAFYANGLSAPQQQGKNFTLRNNAWKMSTVSLTGRSFIRYEDVQVGGVITGSAAIASYTDASRSLTHNAFYSPSANGVAGEYGILTGADAYPANAIMLDETFLKFTNYANTGAIANYTINDLWTGTCTVSAANPAVITAPSVSFPSFIGKGTPFKVDADGTQVLVASRDSATQLTLVGTYPTTGSSKQSTLSFKKWSTDGSDPGVDSLALSNALSGVLTGISGATPPPPPPANPPGVSRIIMNWSRAPR